MKSIIVRTLLVEGAMEYFRDTLAIVTGGGSGIGRGISRELGKQGATVIVTDVNAAGAEETTAAIRRDGGTAKAVRLDVANAGEVRAVIEGAVKEFGRLDYMFNNAGIGIGGRFEDFEPDHWKSILDVNLWGVIHGCLYSYRVMKKQGFGHIINTASLGGLIPSSGTPYPTSKYGVVGLTLSLRIEAALYGVKASVVCPGFVRTAIFDTSMDVSGVFTEEDKKRFFEQFKMITPDECARKIMKGIKRKRAIIPVTPMAWHLWRLNRFFPEFFIKAAIRQTRKFEEQRGKRKG